ncbi:LysR family transcriptional regulator [Acidimangrovimonas pyrenivorans]|uniref:LysR substrate-binding domain-containing protein n=1 Tax=Acidimangrovimonas pyrenivorans TaxID=2030798 RepID=A0ABV7AEV5_9RHOB
MTLEQLRIFIAVAEREHVTRAAEALNLTQSATSAAVAALEMRHGAMLFERVGRRIALTEAGRRFLPEAKAVLARAAAAERLLDDLAGLKTGALQIAASQTLANYWLPPLMLQFHRRHPGIELHLTIGNSEQVAEEVAEMRADLGFAEGPVAAPQLEEQTLPGDEMYLVVAPGHAWTQAAPDRAALLAGTWVLREPGSGTRVAMEEALSGQGLDPAALADRLELTSNEAVRSAVTAGGGATILSHLVVEASLAAGELVRLPFPPLVRRFRLLRHRERHETHAARAFAALLRERVAPPAGNSGD